MKHLEVHSPTLRERDEMTHVHTDFDVRYGYRPDPDAHNAGLPYVDSGTARFTLIATLILLAVVVAVVIWGHDQMPRVRASVVIASHTAAAPAPR